MNKEEIIGKTFNLDLGSSPVEVKVIEINDSKVIVEYLRSTPGKVEEFSISDFEYFAMIKIESIDKELKDIKYGLMVIDPTQECEMMDIIHFVGYWVEPTEEDAAQLREELMTDEEFGLTEIAHRLDILPAPDYIVEEFMKDSTAQPQVMSKEEIIKTQQELIDVLYSQVIDLSMMSHIELGDDVIEEINRLKGLLNG